MNRTTRLVLSTNEQRIAAYCSAVSDMIHIGIHRHRINVCHEYIMDVYMYVNS